MRKFIYRKNRIRGRKAFTLAELMVAMLIMSFAGLIVIGGLAVISRSYQDMLLHSQTQMVLKEYMGEIRSGFLSAELDSELIIDDKDFRPAFVRSDSRHSFAGYYTVVRETESSGTVTQTELGQGETDAAFGTIVFQPVYINYETKSADKGTKKASISLVSTKLSDDFTSKIDYRYDADTQMFSGTVTVKSVRTLSTGEHVVLSGAFSVSPVSRPAAGGN